MMKVILFVALFAAVASAIGGFPRDAPVGCGADISSTLPYPKYVNGSLDNSGVNLLFLVSNQYSSLQFEFSGGNENTYCGGYFQGSNTPTNWSILNPEAACGEDYLVSANFISGKALGRCFAFDNQTDPRFVFYTSTVKVTTTVARPAIRGEVITRNIVTAFRLSFRFQRFIQLTANQNFTAVGYGNATGDVITNEWDPISKVYFIQVLTTIQSPYTIRPHNTGGVITLDNGYVVETAATVDKDCAFSEANRVCVQIWSFEFKFAEGFDPCLFQPSFSLKYSVECATTSLDDLTDDLSQCDDIRKDFIFNFTMPQINYCQVIVDTVTLTGTLRVFNTEPNVFEEAALPAQNWNFLYGQTIYFRADVRADKFNNITETQFQNAIITGSGAPIVMTTGTAASGDYNFQFANNYQSNPRACMFQFTVSAQSAPIVVTENEIDAQTVSVTALIRVLYANLNLDVPPPTVSGQKHALLEVKASNFGMFSTVNLATSTLTSQFTVSRPLTATSSTNSLVPAVAASAAGVALLTAFVAFVLFRRRATEIKKDSVTPPDAKNTA